MVTTQEVICLLFLASTLVCSSLGSVDLADNNPTNRLNRTEKNDDDIKDYESTSDLNGNLTYVYLNASDPDHATVVNATEHAGFLHGFVESLTVILVSELGDKTFFIAAIMAMTCNKLTVFMAAISALALMTVLSALLGFVVTTFIPRVYTYYTCTAIMFLFGLKMLWEAWRMKPDEAAEIQQEVQAELQRRGSIASGLNQPTPQEGEEAGEQPPAEGELTAAEAEGATAAGVQSSREEEDAEAVTAFIENENAEAAGADGTSSPTAISTIIKPKEKKRNPIARRVQIKENSVFGKKCYKVFKVFLNCFTMTFLAEWGDRSQLATIVLASINDVSGVCVGGVLGHSICTGLAVIAGAIIAKKISVRVVTFIGALIFLGFAIASCFLDPESEELIKIDI